MITSKETHWPFIPTHLTDIIDPDTLSVIESGWSERLERPITIIDLPSPIEKKSTRIESINEKRRYEAFCLFLRSENRIRGGDAACKAWDILQANISINKYIESGEPYRKFYCYLGLIDTTYVIRVNGYPVAVVFSGQYLPDEGPKRIQEIVQNIEVNPHIPLPLSSEEKRQLSEQAEMLSPIPERARTDLEQAAKHIQSIAEAEFEKRKRQSEQKFLEELRHFTLDDSEMSHSNIQKRLDDLLDKVTQFCHCKYAIFFASAREGDTVLVPLAKSGILPSVTKLPHFNWVKAGLQQEYLDMGKWIILPGWHEARIKGIKGDNSEYFSDTACLILVSLRSNYRCVLIFGPFEQNVNIQLERPFLTDLASTIGWFALASLQALFLEQERRRWKDTASLLTHEVKTALTPITSQIGIAKENITSGDQRKISKAVDYLKKAEDLSLLLARITTETLEGASLYVGHEDLELERYPLAVLVQNCANGFTEKANQKNVHIAVTGAENLPDADVDVARLTIALANIIENGIKYSFSKSTIYIRTRLNLDNGVDRAAAIIEVDNIGLEITEQERQKIFELGIRGEASKETSVGGIGFGLWESNTIVKAHHGDIKVRFGPTEIYKHEGKAHHVVFTVEIPLRQK